MAWPADVVGSSNASHDLDPAVCEHEKALDPRKRKEDPEGCIHFNCQDCGKVRCRAVILTDYAVHTIKANCRGRSWRTIKRASMAGEELDESERKRQVKTVGARLFKAFDHFPPEMCANRTRSPVCDEWSKYPPGAKRQCR